MKTERRSADVLLSAAMALVFGLIFYTFNTPLGPSIGSDNAMYLTLGTALARGYAPYTQIFDHKGPMLYLLQMLPQLLSGGYSTLAVFIQQVIALFLCLRVVSRIARTLGAYSGVTQLFYLALIASLVGGGNLTEEYASLPTLLGAYAALRVFLRPDWTKRLFAPALLMGVCTMAAFLLRANNALPLAALTLALALCLLAKKQFAPLGQCAAGFAAGLALCALPVVIWLAARGALLYMVNHSLFKLVLFMAAGVVYMNLHKLNLNDVRGFGRKKPILHFAFLMGAVGLMGVPGFSGYVSKTLIHEGIVEYAELLAEEGMGALALLYRGAEWIYLFSGGLTGAYMIKLYICLFWEKHPTQQIAYEAKKPYMGKLSALALLLSAAIVPALGLTPNLTMDKIADIAGGFLNAAAPAHAVHYFSLTNIKGACISLAIGLIVYLLFIRTKLMKKENGVREYIDLWPSWLDIEDRLYRPAIGGLLELGGRFAGLGSETTLETYVYRPMIRALTLFFAAVFGFLGGLTDFVADLIARKVLSARRKKLENRVGNAVTRAVGGVFDGMVEGLNQTVLRGHRIEHHAMARISAAWDGAMDAISQMSHTMSYGLLLFGLGLCVTLLYLMFY